MRNFLEHLLTFLNVFYEKLLQIDRLYDWKKSPESDVAATLKKQKKNTKDEFEERAKAIIVEFAQQVRELSIPYEEAACGAVFSFIALSVTNTGSAPLFMGLSDLLFPLTLFPL